MLGVTVESSESRKCVPDEVRDEDGHTVLVHVDNRSLLSTDAPVLLTYHDFGMTHDSCFGHLLQHPRLASIFSRMAIIHIIAPGTHRSNAQCAHLTARTGQHAGAEDLKPNFDFTLDRLVKQVKAVSAHYALRRFFVAGAGVGAHVMLAFTLDFPRAVRGMLFFGPRSTPAAGAEWLAHRAAAWQWSLASYVSSPGLPQWYRDGILERMFSEAALLQNENLAAVHSQVLATLNVHNVLQFADFCSIIAPLDNRLEETRALTVPVAVLRGRTSASSQAALDFFAQFASGVATLISVEHCGHHVLAERPDELVTPLVLYFQGFGMLRDVDVENIPSAVSAPGLGTEKS